MMRRAYWFSGLTLRDGLALPPVVKPVPVTTISSLGRTVVGDTVSFAGAGVGVGEI